jgi:hypothetical protein
MAERHYGTQDFYLQGDGPMQCLLFDIEKERVIHKANGAPISLGLFKSDAYAHISAVLYSSLATFGKARALGNDEGDITFRAVRKKNNAKPIYIEARKPNYKESLTDGMVLFTNPFASVPINAELFNDCGIRRYVANNRGGFDLSFHPEGDLYFRMVQLNINPVESTSWPKRPVIGLRDVARIANQLDTISGLPVRPFHPVDQTEVQTRKPDSTVKSTIVRPASG